MTTTLMHSILCTAECVYAQMTDSMSSDDIGRSWWSYIRSKLNDAGEKKIRVPDFVREYVIGLDEDAFAKRWPGTQKLRNVKKSPRQLEYLCICVSNMLRFGSVSEKFLDWN